MQIYANPGFCPPPFPLTSLTHAYVGGTCKSRPRPFPGSGLTGLMLIYANLFRSMQIPAGLYPRLPQDPLPSDPQGGSEWRAGTGWGRVWQSRVSQTRGAGLSSGACPGTGCPPPTGVYPPPRPRPQPPRPRPQPRPHPGEHEDGGEAGVSGGVGLVTSPANAAQKQKLLPGE